MVKAFVSSSHSGWLKDVFVHVKLATILPFEESGRRENVIPPHLGSPRDSDFPQTPSDVAD